MSCYLSARHIYYIHTFTHRRTKMFTPEFYIDSFQSTKRLLTNKVITDPTLNKAAHNYIDAQTTFAKEMAKISNTVYNQVTEQVEKFSAKK